MNKKLSLSIIILIMSSIVAYGQQINFQKNTNSRASVLLQSLNNNRDSLLLESQNEHIQLVDIFNEDFSERINVNNNKTKIDLKKLPLGNFVIQAKVNKKWIVMYLEKNQGWNNSVSEQNTLRSNYESLDAKHASNNKFASYYWVVTESNSNFGSRKSMRLEHKNDIDKLISKNKLELQSKVGKDNTLIVYAIYNKSKFMNKQFRNPEYYQSKEKSNFFNSEPFYISDIKKENSSTL